MGNSRAKTLLLVYAICWCCVHGAFQYEPTFKVTRGSCDDDNITVVNTGSNVTFCCITHPIKSTVAVWYKGQEPVMQLTYNSDDCLLQNFISAHRNMIEKACGSNRFSIVLTNVQREDEGEWICAVSHHKQLTRSSKISLKVETQTDSSPASITIPSSPKSSSTTLQSSLTQSTTTTTGREVRTHRNVDAPRHSQSNIVIGGSIGGAILIFVIIIIVAISLRARKNSQSAVHEGSRELYSSLQSDNLDAGHLNTEISGSTGRFQSSEGEYVNIPLKPTETKL